MICVDDGSGMAPHTLRTALRFGGTTRFDDRSGLGRFGMGLPNSSASQCRRLEVYTWEKPNEVYFCYLDIDEIAAGSMLVVPEPIRKEIPSQYEAYKASPTGTMVIWRRCDRLDSAGREDTLTREISVTLGQTYRYFLASGKMIQVNGRIVKPFDPLFLMPEAEHSGAMPHGAPIRIDVPVPGTNGDKSPVTIKFSLLPEEWQMTIGKSTKKLREYGIDRSRGFSIVRAGREVDFGRFRLRRPHWTDSWWGCEISFEPDLDELFGVTHTKQQVKLHESIRERIEKDISANLATLSDIIVSRGRKAHATNSQKAEIIAKERDKYLRTSPTLRGKDPDLAERELRAYAESRSGDGVTVDEVLDNIRDRPLLMDFENLPGAPFYRVRTYGTSTVVTLNREHPFFARLYQPLCDKDPASKTALELLLFALAKAETLAEDEGMLWYRSQRQEWSRVLEVYLESVESLDRAFAEH
ncbi:MAG: hypothetical protein D6695_05855 [Planctomycetota bacterium]|nr:MAG: hypothetical protein D6695_05855 [Planctomycetota bacterium]